MTEVASSTSVAIATTSPIIHVCNIAPQATRDMLYTLFSFVSKVEEIRLFPLARDAMMTSARTAFVRFADSHAVSVCGHLNNTVFIDRAIIVNAYNNNVMPEEPEGLMLAQQQANSQAMYACSETSTPLPPHVVNRIEGLAPHSVVQTEDPNLAANGLPDYPPLPGGTTTNRVEEIRRTVCVVNVEDGISAQSCMDLFKSRAGEIKFFRFCTRPNDPFRYALIEFAEQPSVVKALMLNDEMLGQSRIKVTHALQAVVKPSTKSNEAAQREIEEAMLKVKEAQSLVSAAVDPLMGMLGVSTTSKKSPSRGRSKSPSRSSRSRRERRSRSRRRRSRSRHRSKHRKRSSSKSKKKRSRSRSKDKKRRSKSKDRKDGKSKNDKKESKDKKDDKDKKDNKDKDKKESKSSKKEDGSKSKSDDTKKESIKEEIKKEITENTKQDKKEESTTVVDENGGSKSNGVSNEEKSSRRRSRSSSRKRSTRRRSRSRDRKRHRSRSRKRKHRSRSKDRKRSESRERSKKKSKKHRSPSAEKNKDTKKYLQDNVVDKAEVSKDVNKGNDENQMQNETASDDMEISNSP